MKQLFSNVKGGFMRRILFLLCMISMAVLLPMQALAVDVASIEKPTSMQTLYFEPVEILVQFKDGAAPKTFRAVLNFSHDITNRFVPVENGMRALIDPADGLQIKNPGEFFLAGFNFLTTTTKNMSGRKDIDARIFQVKEGGDEDTVITTILQTSDLHHHGYGYGPFLDYSPDTLNDDSVTGGYARIATVINQVRAEQAAKDVPVMLFDSGDFLMGTNYDLTAANPLAFKFFTMMDYDAITLGNHEFDWSPAGLAMLLSNAVNNGFNVPVLATNMVTDSGNPADNGLEYFLSIGKISGKSVIELDNGLKVGLLGLMGEDADEKAPIAPPVTFNHDYDFIQSQVDELKNSDGAQLIVALSHSGVSSSGEGDDANLANGVDGIDLIASGHEHTATHEAFDESGTLIFSPGEYGEYVSRMDIAYSISQGRIVDSKFALIPVDDSIPGDPYVQGMIEFYNDSINAGLFPVLGVTLGSPISKTDFSLTLPSLQESGLGNLVADASRTIASQLAVYSADPTPFAFSVVPSGVIRHNIDPGETGYITFADIYNTLPLGISPDATQPLPGYPLMSVYLTAGEIRNVLEAGLTLAPQLGSDYFLNFSGVRVEYDITMAPYLQGVTSINLCGNALPAPYGDQDLFCTSCDTELDLAGTDLYRCVVDLYAMQMMHVITTASGGNLVIVPKHADGNPINMGNPADYMQCRIDADPAKAGVQELKEWIPLLKFLGSVFPASGAGIPETVYGGEGIAMGRVATP